MKLTDEYKLLLGFSEKVQLLIRDWNIEIAPFARGNKKAIKALKKLLEFEDAWRKYFVEKEASYWIEKDIQHPTIIIQNFKDYTPRRENEKCTSI